MVLLTKDGSNGEVHVKVIQDTCEGSTTTVKCAVGSTNWFNVKVGLHQGLAINSLLLV